MPLSLRSGFGAQSVFLPVTSLVAGVNTVLPNIGAGVQVVAGPVSLRLTKLSWRVDLAPDVAAGTVNVPTLWRVFVVAGILPPDATTWQVQAYPNGSHPEIPAILNAGSPLPILWDEWLDFGNGDPGLNRVFSRDWADAGPSVGPAETLSAIVMPIIDANLSNALPGAAMAQLLIAISGCPVTDSAGAPGGGRDTSRSLPRFDVSHSGS